MPNVIPVKCTIVAAREFDFPGKSGGQVKGKMYYALTEDGKLEFSAPLDSDFPLSKKVKYDKETATDVFLVCTGFNYNTNQLKYRVATEAEQQFD